jgi:hypothetical protein
MAVAKRSLSKVKRVEASDFGQFFLLQCVPEQSSGNACVQDDEEARQAGERPAGRSITNRFHCWNF